MYYTLEYVCCTKSWLFCHQGLSSCGLLSFKVTVKSENRNRGIRKASMPRSILRKTKTFYYVPRDLRLQAVGGCGLVKEPVKGKNRLSSTHEPPSLSSVSLSGLWSHYTVYSVKVRWIMKVKPWFTYVIHLSQNARGDGDGLTVNLEPPSIFYEVLVIHTNSVEIHDTVTPELVGLRTLLVPVESGRFPAWEMFSLIRLCFDHLENGAGEEHLWEVDNQSGPGSFEQQLQRDLQSTTWIEWVHGGIAGKLVELNVGHTEANSWKVEESWPSFNSSMYHWPCLNGFFRTWTSNGNAERITNFFFYLFTVLSR